MVGICAAGGCYTKCSNGSISLFNFPGDNALKKQWIDNIQHSSSALQTIRIRPASKLCQLHFEQEQFFVSPELASSIGFRQKFRLKLKPNALPTLFDAGHSAGKYRKLSSPAEENSMILEEYNKTAAASAVDTISIKNGPLNPAPSWTFDHRRHQTIPEGQLLSEPGKPYPVKLEKLYKNIKPERSLQREFSIHGDRMKHAPNGVPSESHSQTDQCQGEPSEHSNYQDPTAANLHKIGVKSECHSKNGQYQGELSGSRTSLLNTVVKSECHSQPGKYQVKNSEPARCQYPKAVNLRKIVVKSDHHSQPGQYQGKPSEPRCKDPTTKQAPSVLIVNQNHSSNRVLGFSKVDIVQTGHIPGKVKVAENIDSCQRVITQSQTMCDHPSRPSKRFKSLLHGTEFTWHYFKNLPQHFENDQNHGIGSNAPVDETEGAISVKLEPGCDEEDDVAKTLRNDGSIFCEIGVEAECPVPESSVKIEPGYKEDECIPSMRRDINSEDGAESDLLHTSVVVKTEPVTETDDYMTSVSTRNNDQCHNGLVEISGGSVAVKQEIDNAIEGDSLSIDDEFIYEITVNEDISDTEPD